MKRIVISASVCFLVVVAVFVFKGPNVGLEEGEAAPPSSTPYERITIAGETTLNGVYDLAIEYDENGIGWMVYTAVVYGSYHYTHLAKTSDNGRTWQYVSRANDPSDDTVMVQGQPVSGVWRNEVPTLIYDPTDPDPGKKWKMFWHKYFAKDPGTSISDRMFDYGWIAYKSADTPENLANSEEVRLLGADPNPKDPATGFIGYPVNHYLNRLDASLMDYVFFSEPGALVRDEVLYLSFDAGTTISGMYEWENYKTILISSPDHGETWAYAGVLTDFTDAMSFNYVVFTATSLVASDGTTYLLATPSGSTRKPNKHHDGVCIIEFTDITQARLKRDRRGKLAVTEYLKPYSGADFGGQSDYDFQNTNAGVVMSNVVTGGFDVFQIYNTNYNIGTSVGGPQGRKNR